MKAVDMAEKIFMINTLIQSLCNAGVEDCDNYQFCQGCPLKIGEHPTLKCRFDKLCNAKNI